MTKVQPQSLVYVVAAPGGQEALRAARDLRRRIEAEVPEGSLEARELPGVLWGFSKGEGQPGDRLSAARLGPRESLLRGDPVWIEPLSPRRCEAADLLRVWEREGSEAVRLIDNLSLAIVADEGSGELDVATDRTGAFRVYEARIGELTVLCTSYLLLARIVPLKDIDPEGIALFLNLGYFPANRTAMRSVQVHPFASLTRIRGGAVSSKPYWRPRMDVDVSRPLREVLEEGVAAFNATVREFAAGHDEVVLAMTAGLDSRTVASSLIRQRIPFRTYTHGFPGSWEVRRVEPMVRRHTIPHVSIPLTRTFTSHLAEFALESFRATEGEVACVEKCHLIHVLYRLRELTEGRRVVLHLGGGAGMLKGSNYRLLRDEDLWTPKSVERFVAWNLARRLPDIFAMRIPAREPETLRSFVASALEEAGDGTLFQRLDYFYLVRYRRWAGGVKCIYRRFFPVREPFVSYRLLEYLFPTDPAVKKAKLPHFEIMARNYPSIRLDLTNKMSPALPLSMRTLHRFLPSVAWRAKQLLRGFSRRFLSREIFPLIDYVDYPRWIREPEGRQFVHEWLDPRRMSTASLYDGERLRDWLSGEPSFALLDRILTLELFFREVERP